MPESTKHLLERLFEEQRGALTAFFRRRIRAKPDAADLAQEVYLRMLRVKNTADLLNPEGYLFTVASNLAKEHALLERRRGLMFDAEDSAIARELVELPHFEQDADMAIRVKRLEAVLAQLSPKCRAAVLLQFKHGLSYDEIGKRLGVSRNMVKKYLSQGLAHCRRRMSRLG